MGKMRRRDAGAVELSKADRIWNRAALNGGGQFAQEGDRVLAALLRVHGMIMNGGIGHAFDVLDENEMTLGTDGFRYFGLSEVVDLLDGAKGLSEGEREKLTEDYARLVPTDSSLADAFEKVFCACPEKFAPASE